MEQLVSSKSPKTQSYKHAIVIGGSIAGLSAARVLSDYFEKVTIFERDILPETPDFRKGVPQGRQPHMLLKRGQMIMDEFFPGFTEVMRYAGANPINMGGTHWHAFGVWRPQFDSSIELLGGSRLLIEHTVRKFLKANPKIRFVTECEVIGLEVSEDKTYVIGIKVRMRPGAEAKTIDADYLKADFVVDASGRESRAPQWLESLGYVAPEETTVDSRTTYATRIFECPADYRDQMKMIYIQPFAPGIKRGAIFLPMEGGTRWYVTMIGMAGDAAPTDEAGYMEFARSLPVSLAYDTLQHLIPVSPVAGYARAANRLRHYHELPRYLENFALLGDAVFAFNPVYGQGMTTATISAQEFGNCLREYVEQGSLDGLAEAFQKRLVGIITMPWQMATSEDFRWYPELAPEVDQETRLMQQYMEKVMIASCTNPNVADVLYRVMMMVEPPTIFFRPDVVLQVVNEMVVA